MARTDQEDDQRDGKRDEDHWNPGARFRREPLAIEEHLAGAFAVRHEKQDDQPEQEQVSPSDSAITKPKFKPSGPCA